MSLSLEYDYNLIITPIGNFSTNKNQAENFNLSAIIISAGK